MTTTLSILLDTVQGMCRLTTISFTVITLSTFYRMLKGQTGHFNLFLYCGNMYAGTPIHSCVLYRPRREAVFRFLLFGGCALSRTRRLSSMTTQRWILRPNEYSFVLSGFSYSPYA